MATRALTSPATGVHHYRVHGIGLVSDIDLDALLPPVADRPPARRRGRTIDVYCAPVEFPAGPAPVTRDGLRVAGQTVYAATPGLGRFAATARSIRYDPHDGADLDLVRHDLLGICLGSALHFQPGLPVHCAAIDTPAGCIVFAGNAGDGKSTLAASLATHGFRLFCDDRLLLVPEPAHGGALTAAPSVPALHLGDDAARLSGIAPATTTQKSSRAGKKVYVLPDRFASRAKPVAGLYFTSWHDGAGQPARLDPMDPVHALMRLRRDICYTELATLLGNEQRVFSLAADLCRQVPAFHLLRPRDASLHAAALDLIMNHLHRTFAR